MLTTHYNELVHISLSPKQNEALEESFKSFYQLPESPKISRKFVLEKSEYNSFFKAKAKEYTKFQAQDAGLNLSFDEKKIPFKFVGTITEFKFPGGKNAVVNEELDSPNGITKRVAVSFGLGQDVCETEFPSYFHAEAYILAQFLKKE